MHCWPAMDRELREGPQVIAPIDVTPANQLVSELAGTLTRLLAKHVELAKAEAIMQARREAKTAVGFLVAGVLIYAGLLLLLCAGVLALALVLPGWAAALLVGVVVLAAAGIAAYLGYRQRVRRPLWRTRETLAEDARWLRPRTI